MKYKVGDKVTLTNGDTMTVYQINDTLKWYFMREDPLNCYTDEMIECKVEEETKPKYEDEVNGEYYSTTKYLVRPSGYQFVDENGNVINAQKIVLKKLVVPKFKKGDKIKDKNNRVWYVVHVGNKHFDISSVPNGSDGSDLSGYFVPMEDQDDYELCPDKELPKTYEECCKVLDFCGEYFFTTYEEGIHLPENNNVVKIHQILKSTSILTKLIICRNAYWKLAGEEMGLNKPWAPDYNDLNNTMYGLYDELKYSIINPSQFVFPSKEMRDEFAKNFKKDIDFCK